MPSNTGHGHEWVHARTPADTGCVHVMWMSLSSPLLVMVFPLLLAAGAVLGAGASYYGARHAGRSIADGITQSGVAVANSIQGVGAAAERTGVVGAAKLAQVGVEAADIQYMQNDSHWRFSKVSIDSIHTSTQPPYKPQPCCAPHSRSRVKMR